MRNAPTLPQRYSESSTGENIANMPFWQFFRSEELHELIRTGLRENKDLAQALSRISEARARVGFVRADQFPALDIIGDAARVGPSNAKEFFSRVPYNDFRLASQLAFEIDLWGKLRRATEAERASLLGSEFAYRAATLLLVSEIASTYFLLLDLDNRCSVADGTIKNRKDATALIRSRFRHGIVPELDVHQAEVEEAEAEATRAMLERARRQAENALNVLLGRAPQPIPRTVRLNRDLLAAVVPLGFPAELLERRPDVMAAEQQARALFAQIGVAQAQRLPSIPLFGTIGLNTSDISDLFKREAFYWNIGAGLTGPLVDFGKSRSRVEVVRAQAEQAVQNYQQTVLVAVREVEDSLASIRTYQAENLAREMQRSAASSAGRLSRARYNDGVTTYLEVLDIERSLFNAELAVSTTQGQYLTSIVRLYTALGGGWMQEER